RAELLRVAVALQRRLRRRSEREPLRAEPDHVADLEHDDQRNRDAERQVASEALADLLDVDVEHHHDEQEQHHHGADVDEHEHDREELGLDQQPERGALHEREHDAQHRMHGVACRDHADRGGDEERREHVKENAAQQNSDFLFLDRGNSTPHHAARKPAGQEALGELLAQLLLPWARAPRNWASAALSAAIMASYLSPTASSLSFVMMFSPRASMWYSWIRVSTIASTGQASSQKPQ